MSPEGLDPAAQVLIMRLTWALSAPTGSNRHGEDSIEAVSVLKDAGRPWRVWATPTRSQRQLFASVPNVTAVTRDMCRVDWPEGVNKLDHSRAHELAVRPAGCPVADRLPQRATPEYRGIPRRGLRGSIGLDLRGSPVMKPSALVRVPPARHSGGDRSTGA